MRSICLLCLLLLAAPVRHAVAQEPTIVLVLGHAAGQHADAVGLFLKPWAQRLAIESGGRIRVELRPAGGAESASPDLFEGLASGRWDLAWGPIAHAPGRFAPLDTFELPFMAWSAETVSQAVAGLQATSAPGPRQGLRILLVHADAPSWLHMADGPVRRLEDLRGRRVYAETAKAREFLRALGAEAVGDDGSAGLREALGAGTLDGVLMSFEAAAAHGVDAVTRYHTQSGLPPGLATRIFALALAETRYRALPADLRSLLESAGGDERAGQVGRLWDSLDRHRRKSARRRGHVFYRLGSRELARWYAAGEPVFRGWSAAVRQEGAPPEQLLDHARELAAKYHVLETEEPEALTRPPLGRGG